MQDYAALRTAMVDCQVRPSDVTLYPVIAAMLAVRREDFVPRALRPIAYSGAHLAVAPGRVVLDPRVFARMLDALNPAPDALVLDIAPGHGYSTAVLARLVAAVVAVEEDAGLARAAAEALSDAGVDAAVIENAPHAGGAPAHGPFDALFVNGGVEVLPEALTTQVKPGGRIVAIFRDGPLGQCRLGIRGQDGISWRNVFDASAPVLLGFEKEKEFML